jgi:hypothetical protein
MARAARLLNDRSSQDGASDNRSHITGMHNRALGSFALQLPTAADAQKAVSPDLRTLTCGSFELRRNAETGWQTEEQDGEASQPHARGQAEGTAS